MESKFKIQSPTGLFHVNVGKISNGHINIISNFNPINNPQFCQVIAKTKQVKEISALNNYGSGLGGISLAVNPKFDYQEFMLDMADAMQYVVE
jgi:hypothetical protein